MMVIRTSAQFRPQSVWLTPRGVCEEVHGRGRGE